MYSITCVPSADILELRTKILRPGQWPDIERYVQDDFETTYHFNARDETQTIGVATFIRHQPPQDFDIPIFLELGAIQLRGMAVHEDYRRCGVGAKIVNFATTFLVESGFSKNTLLWFNARQGAIPFYEALGFKCEGDFFNVPNIGPHKIMWRQLGHTS